MAQNLVRCNINIASQYILLIFLADSVFRDQRPAAEWTKSSHRRGPVRIKVYPPFSHSFVDASGADQYQKPWTVTSSRQKLCAIRVSPRMPLPDVAPGCSHATTRRCCGPTLRERLCSTSPIRMLISRRTTTCARSSRDLLHGCR